MEDLLRKIQIHNFQAHEDLEFEFGQGITSITGPSDKGKSAIIRALLWNMTNKPSGDAFIRFGTSECSVKLWIGNHVIERIRTKKQNSYILDGVEYKALKTDVPEEIRDIFNISENNIQNQFDSIFWFSNSPGDVARQLNRIVDLDIIDYTLTNLQSQIREQKQKGEILNQLILEQESTIHKCSLVERCSCIIERIGKLEQKSVQLNVQFEKLQNVIRQIERNYTIVLILEEWDSVQRDIDLDLEKLLDYQKIVLALEQKIQEISQLKKIKDIPSQLFEDIETVEEKYSSLVALRRRYKSFSSLVLDCQKIGQDLEQQEQQAIQTETKMHLILKNNICPLCGRGENK